jgi:hypothetical protein
LSDGLVTVSAEGRGRGLAGRRVAGLDSDGGSGALAVVAGYSLVRRSSDCEWSELGSAEVRMKCCLAVNDAVYAGTEGAHLLRVDSDGGVERVEGFDAMRGRDAWFAGSALVDGEVVGPPLGVRSLAGANDGRLLFAGVHVGGIARSVDGGITWHPTIDIEWDVHEVAVDPRDPEKAAAACAVGLCTSLDGGTSWTLHPPDVEATHCSAVAFAGGDVFVSVSDGPFASHGTVLRRAVDARGSLRPVGSGLPDRLEGVVDTGCIAAKGTELAVVDRGGNVHVSGDRGRSWTRVAEGIPEPSGALVI